MPTDTVAPAGEPNRLLGIVLAAVLVFDGALTAVLEALFLPLYIGSVPFPITAVIAGFANVWLIRGMTHVTSRPLALAAPILAWVAAFLFCASSGTGNDVVLPDNWPTAALLVGGLVPAGLALFRRSFTVPDTVSGS
ncbi:hypothetical protein [Nocardia stercoris]|uniref:Uncharacterized protein n=1 Tax=Nocardia stercoris TaxID=2483361 RepID=A0A3M2LGB9_9NOCA|nr:hypothetical protein [Nocardia stercoris]RMI34995.1 hypothetical protein EBN03_01225 [Nocardia stercoris]